MSEGRSSAQDGTAQAQQQQQQLDEKVQAKRSFSKFLDEVTSNVFDPNSLQALRTPASPSTTTEEERFAEVARRTPRPPCSMAQKQDSAPGQETTTSSREEQLQGTYLETDIDAIGGDDRLGTQYRKEGTPSPRQEVVDDVLVIPPPPQFCQGFEMKTLFPEFYCRLPRHPYRSVSLPRGINMVSQRCGQWQAVKAKHENMCSRQEQGSVHIESKERLKISGDYRLLFFVSQSKSIVVLQ